MSEKEPEYRNLRVPPWCPLCGKPMMGRSTSTYYDFGVCVYCFIQFIEGREQRWKDGWRPSGEQISAYLSQNS